MNNEFQKLFDECNSVQDSYQLYIKLTKELMGQYHRKITQLGGIYGELREDN